MQAARQWEAGCRSWVIPSSLAQIRRSGLLDVSLEGQLVHTPDNLSYLLPAPAGSRLFSNGAINNPSEALLPACTDMQGTIRREIKALCTLCNHTEHPSARAFSPTSKHRYMLQGPIILRLLFPHVQLHFPSFLPRKMPLRYLNCRAKSPLPFGVGLVDLSLQ